MTSPRIFLESGAQHLPRAGRALVLITALMSLGLAPVKATGARPPRYAQPGDITCTLTLLAKDRTITAGEPLLARVEIHSQAKQEVKLWSGGHCLTIYDGQGKVVAELRPESIGGWQGVPRIGPGENRSRVWVISGLYQFSSPGRYKVRVQQLGFSKDMPVLSEDAASVQVLPYNAAKLEAACAELFAPLRNPSLSSGAIPRTKALYSVRDDVVLPYLDWMAREWADSYACRAMRRIGTPRAKKLLAALAARKDRVGKAARDASKIPLEITDWDVLAE